MDNKENAIDHLSYPQQFIGEGYGGELYRKPFYNNNSDYNTNAKSYYDYLAQYNGFLNAMVDFINNLADKVGRYNNHSYYINILTLGCKGDNQFDNTPIFENCAKEQMYYVPHGTYRTEFIPHGRFFGWGKIKYKNETIPLSVTSPQRVRINIDKDTDERYQSFILGQNAGHKVSDHTYSMTGVGYSVFKENIHGRRLTALGKGAMSNMLYGYSNVGVGSDALGQGQFGQRNVAIGDNALKWGGVTDAKKTLHDFWLAKGNQNFVNDYFVKKYPDVWKYLGTENAPNKDLYPNGDGDYTENVAIGRNALLHGMSISKNVAIGYNSMAHAMRGADNTATGNRTLRDNIAGSRNSAYGSYALTNNITGQDNTSVGSNTMQQTLHGSNNTALGYGAMHFFHDDKNKNTDETREHGNRNTAIGTQTMQNGKNANYSVMVGSYAGRYVEGNHNVGLGAGALQQVDKGELNTGVGGNTLREVKKGKENVALGYTAGPSGDYTNTVSIGTRSHANSDNMIMIGNTDHKIYSANPIQNASDRRVKENITDTKIGLDFVNHLKPVDFTYINGKQRHHGFIAQDIASLKDTFYGLHNSKEDGGEDLYSIAYTDLIAPIVKSVQELSAQVKQLQKENKELRGLIND